MGDLVPVPQAAPPDPAQIAAVATAALRIATEEMAKAQGPLLTRTEAEAIFRKALGDAFVKAFDCDLEKPESVRELRATIEHAQRSRTWWDKATNTIWAGVWTAVAAALIAAVTKYAGAAR